MYQRKVCNKVHEKQLKTNPKISGGNNFTNNGCVSRCRSRTTSNVLYAVSEQENIASIISQKSNYVLNPPTQQSTKPDLVISNTCPLYQNADDLYSEPGKNHKRVENSNYERIRSFIINGNGKVKESTGSYAEPSVVFSGIHISENTGYVSAMYQCK